MADLGMTFDPSTVPPSEGFDNTPMPNGKYVVAMTASEKTATKANDGSWYLKCEFTVMEGQFANRKLWHNLNLQNQNEVAVKIAQQDLSAICAATGVGATKNSEDFHNKPMVVNVRTTKDDGYGPGNKITQFAKLEGSVAGSIAPRVTAAPVKGFTPPPFARKVGT